MQVARARCTLHVARVIIVAPVSAAPVAACRKNTQQIRNNFHVKLLPDLMCSRSFVVVVAVVVIIVAVAVVVVVSSSSSFGGWDLSSSGEQQKQQQPIQRY